MRAANDNATYDFVKLVAWAIIVVLMNLFWGVAAWELLRRLLQA